MINEDEINEDSDSNDADEEDQKPNWSICFFLFLSPHIRIYWKLLIVLKYTAACNTKM